MRFGCVLFVLLVSTSAVAAPADDFKAACLATGQASDANCTCQAKLAEGTLNSDEFVAVTAGMSGKRQDYIAAINKMTPDEAKAFHNKMDDLSAKAQATCSQIP